MKMNRHQEQIPPAVLEAAQGKVNELLVLLAPYVSTLTPDERRGMAKMGRKTFSFVEKAYEFAKQNPPLCPPYLDMAAFGSDFADAHGLWTLLNTIHQFAENLDDTQMTAGGEAFQAALIFYSSVHTAAAQDISGAKAVYEELRTRFPGGRRKIMDGDEQALVTGVGTEG
ncbi:hypothetical protein FACS1894147_00360 [Spirochaetia bacterium]|nr:hypothetical protein FACS1894147_00360 [Spirochaetia bacterium]